MQKSFVVELSPSAFREILVQTEKYYLDDQYQVEKEPVKEQIKQKDTRRCFIFNGIYFIETLKGKI